MDSFKSQFVTLLILFLVLPFQATGDDCVYTSTCKNKSDCDGPCKDLGILVGLCVPDPHPGGKLVCCCFVGKS
ncbi:unnamed protein product [Withania somnifera]